MAFQPFYIFGHAIDSAFPWLTRFKVTNPFGGHETGIDIGTAFHTPITSLTSGTVVGTGYYGGGGVVSVQTLVNGQPANVYYQHLDTIDVRKGATVTPGTVLGLSGGQLSGGAHPSLAQFSNGPHVEIGIDAPYGSFWNPGNLGTNVNPLPWLQSVLTGAAGAGNTVGGLTSDAISQGISQAFTNVGNTIKGNLGIHGVSDFIWRSLLILGGMTLIVIGLLVFFSKQAGEAVNVAVSTAAKAAPAAAAA